MNAAKPYTKAAYRVDRAEDIGIGLARAIRAAVSGRPGGVYLDLPASVLGATLEAGTGERSLVRVVDATPRQLPAPESVQRALETLAKAERPLIILGKGAAYAQTDADIRAFVAKTGIPFLPMSMAKGLLPDDHPQSTAAARSYALAQADVVMLIGARLNWLLGHGKSPQWSPTAQFVQLDIVPTEMDSNRAIAAPVVGDIASSVSALLAMLKPGQIRPRSAWLDELARRKQRNLERMATHLAANPDPMDFYSALGAIKGVLADQPEVYLVNEGANTLDIARNVIDMCRPRKRLDSGTWGVMGIGMGYAIGAAVVSGKPVVAIEGDSALGFSGMEIGTVCRYHLPIVTVVFNNGGIYRGEVGRHALQVALLAPGELIEPCGTRPDLAGLEHRQQGRHGRGNIPYERRSDGAIAVHLSRRDIQLNELRRRRPLRALTVAQQPVQPRADQHHHIGLRQCVGSGRRSRLRVVVGQQALGHGHGQEGDPGLLDECANVSVCLRIRRSFAQDDERPLSFSQHIEGALD